MMEYIVESAIEIGDPAFAKKVKGVAGWISTAASNALPAPWAVH